MPEVLGQTIVVLEEICVARKGIQEPFGISRDTGGKSRTEDMSMISIVNWCGRDFESFRVKVLSKGNLSGSGLFII
jgi:hypothetical protein